ncbi:MAG TPA: hypothetical protein VG298_01855 [Acidimicrobiales bacterium]|jgi:hypothetical protein|nr:hypothetical protein [Acidimicrobiales bacterium]
MAIATVFVDDGVLGHFPPVCAKTGLSTGDHLTLTVPVGNRGLGLAWLLVLVGPLGWLVLFLYALTQRDETLTVRLPFSQRAHDEFTKARRQQRVLGWGAVVALSGALLVLILQSFTARAAAAALAVIGLGLLASWCSESRRVRRAGVGVQLDGSRRWVTLTRVHDEFARAVPGLPGAAPERRTSRQPA